MKRIFFILLIFVLTGILGSGFVSAEQQEPTAKYSGAGASFGKGSKEQDKGAENQSSGEDADVSVLFDYLYHLIFGASSVSAILLYRINLSKSARNSKKIMALLDDKDSAWKFKNILPQVKNIFYEVKKAWADGDIVKARQFLTEDMCEQLKTKLNWLDYRGQKNIVNRVKLLDSRPVAVFDCHDDSCDHIWFYMEWRNVDYIVDCLDNRIISGSKFGASFEEFWQFTRTDGDRWILSKTVSAEEGKKMFFGEEEETLKNRSK